MGSWFSSEKKEQAVTNDGVLSSANSNEVIINESVPIHSDLLVTLLIIIVIIKVLEFIIKIYRMKQQSLKKKYKSRFNINTV